jgi:hypothetical protein
LEPTPCYYYSNYIFSKEERAMDKLSMLYSTIAGKVGSSTVKFVLFLLVIILFVLGSGAPEAGGGIINSGRIFGF